MASFVGLVASFWIVFPSAHAADFRVLGIQNEVLYESDEPVPVATLGEWTDRLLDRALREHRITEYRGSDGGVLSINRLTNAIEVLSDTEMKAYGWCYTVDGIESGLLANQYVLNGLEKKIVWFYAYAHMRGGQWREMCVPARHLPIEE